MSISRERVRADVEDLLGVPAGALGEHDDLLGHGLDSLRTMRLAGRWRRDGARVGFAELIERPTLAAWCSVLAERAGAGDRTGTGAPAPPGPASAGSASAGPASAGPASAGSAPGAGVAVEVDETAPFELALMQHAYWVGRSDGQRLGGVAAHFYHEFDGWDVRPDRLEAAVRALLARHGMLRAQIGDDGRQRILPTGRWPGLRVHDLRQMPIVDAERALRRLREELSHRRMDPSAAEVFDIQLSLLPAGMLTGPSGTAGTRGRQATRTHVNLDMLAADAQSLRVLLADLAALYRAPAGSQLPALTYSYPRYLAERSAAHTGPGRTDRERDREYWRQRLPELPAAPQLPVAAGPPPAAVRVVRRHHWLDPGSFRRFRQRAAGHGLTPAMALAAVFAEILAAWSAEPEFLLNLPLFGREPPHPDVPRLVGDFTSSVLLAVDGGTPGTFTERARRLQARFHADAGHAGYSGVEVLRDLSRQRGEQVLAPVVYTSALGLGELFDPEVRGCFGQPSWIISQGPQVWLDAQATELDGGLLANWDAREDAFAPGVLDAMFGAYTALLDRLLADGPAAWTAPVPALPPAGQLAVRDRANDTTGPVPAGRLHDRFFARAATDPDRTAVLGADRRVSYRELAGRALRVAARLVADGVRPGELVAVSLPRGVDQIAAVLGVLAAGAAYLPVGVGQPAARRQRILRSAGVRYVLDGSVSLQGIEPLAAPVPGGGAGLAYVIYTSGSTGEPKGVQLSHTAALNTVADLNERFQVDGPDRFLAVSALDFDLSVYDIFGPLSVGGALVLVPDAARRDATAWIELVRRHQVTVLNCVPALLDMLLVAAGGAELPLRLVLLGGDRIGPDLPRRLAAVAPAARFVGLGGTTETAIHSTVCEVVAAEVPADWTCVPYGTPLRNVRCRVVDPLGRDRPDWVPGELWIGGAGVASGYRGDPARTAEKFVELAGLRWYRTGDLARYRPDGTVEFLGRLDHQVKIRGHRVELGELEAAVTAYPAVAGAVALAVGDGADRRLAVAVTSTVDTDPTAAGEAGAQPPVSGDPPAGQADTQPAGPPVPALPPGTGGRTRPDGQAELVDSFLAHLLELLPGTDPRLEPVVRLWRDRLGDRSVPDWPTARRAASGWLAPIADALEARTADLAAVLRGAADPVTLLDDPVLAPDALLHALPDTPVALDAVAAAIREQAGALGRPVRVAELGARSGRTAEYLLRALPLDAVRYTLLDPSKGQLAGAARRVAGLPHDPDFRQIGADLVPEPLRHWFDLVLAFGSLHGYPEPVAGPALAALLLAPEGLLWTIEQPELPPLGLLSAALLEHGFDRLDPVRRRRHSPMLTAPEWRPVMAAAGLVAVESARCGDLYHLRARRPAVAGPDVAGLRAFLADRLPAAMVPDRIMVLPRIPLSANGKIDRPRLARLLAAADPAGPAGPEPAAPPAGEVERRVAAAWSDLLGVSDPIGREHDFFALGGDSLSATRLVGRLRAAGLGGVRLAELFTRPRLMDFAATLTVTGRQQAMPAMVADPQNRYQPFPATDVQRAYWIGRGTGMVLGGVGTHYYSEFDGPEVDLVRFERAWRRLIERHDMLRAVFDEDGRQRVLPEVPEFRIPVREARGDGGTELAELRAAMSHQVLDPARWPLFDVRAVRYRRDGRSRTRIGISLDNIVLDGLSMMVVFSELDRLYTEPAAELPPIDVSFRDYVLGVRPEPAALAASQDYWRGRLAELPPAPALPLRADPSLVDSPGFERWSARLPAAIWRRLKDQARRYGLTPSTVLLACYAEVLGAWSGRRDVTVNLTLFDRREVHPHINRVLGDFTSLLLAEYRPEPGDSWLAAARRLQERTWRDLDHRDVPAMWVMRELARARGVDQVAMPAVFTSTLGVDNGVSLDTSGAFGERVWGISQTPQIWLDLQVHESRGDLHYALDAVPELFPAGVPAAMFEAFAALLDWLGDADWDAPVPALLPAGQAAARAAVNDTGPATEGLLHHGFFAQAERRPDRIALTGDTGTVSYRELADRALRIAGRLVADGVRPGEAVAVSLPKGPDQIAAVLGVLAAGAAYVPVGVDQPAARRERILRSAGVRCVLDGSVDPQGIEPLPGPVPVAPAGLAYVIYTSGSTGEPKGVETSHAAAFNTVHDINQRYRVGPSDRVLAVSALDFDLSVYDIFGPLSAGGALVLITEDDRRDAGCWLRLADRYRVTVWNTVPALLDMLLVAGERAGFPAGLRLALVSGDWVGLDLPGRLRDAGRCRLVALGGATEAAIWSNAYEAAGVPAGWTSVPYGFPLRGQRFRVVDGAGRDCPDWVPGELWIGGAGVALGYRGDPDRTAAKFGTAAGGRWYRTGDRGRYRPGGILEFLGRFDHQVKIRGHRIEPGEVEAALVAHPLVRDAVVVAVGERARRRLMAGLVPEESTMDTERLRADLAELLPGHAIPGTILVLDAFPLTGNGKVDRAALARLAATGAPAPDATGGPPAGRTETLLAGIWADLLELPAIGRDQHFFTLGGDSLAATRLVERLRREHGIELSLRQVFAAPTLADLATLINQRSAQPDEHMEEGVL